MNRAELLKTLAMAEALAASARTLLKQEAELEWTENGTRAVWDTKVGQAVASIHHDALDVEDEQAFLRWLRAGLGATEVYEVTELRVRNPEWLKTMLTTIAEGVAAGTCDAPPGTKLLEGGGFKTLSITFDRELKQRFAKEALLAVQQGGPFTIDPSVG